MKEDFLYFLWRYQYIDNELYTSDGERIVVHHPGYRNHGSGPDFLQARIQIGDTLWAGNVEIHLRASDWMRHGHDSDPVFQGVILHVVQMDDTPVYRSSGGYIPALQLEGMYDNGLYASYMDLLGNQAPLPCYGQIDADALRILSAFLPRLAVERQERKVARLEEQLSLLRGDTEELVYAVIASGFGIPHNREPFEILARQLPFSLLRKYLHDELAVEALVFGQSGLISASSSDQYPRRLWKEYCYLRAKHNLSPVSPQEWKFHRMRPSGFPTLRLAAFSAFLGGKESLKSWTEGIRSADDVLSCLGNVNSYWHEHYIFDKPALFHSSLPAGNFSLVLAVNVLIPLMFFISGMTADEELRLRATGLLEKMPPEDNKVVRRWAELGLSAHSALEAQAMLELTFNYCDEKKCLSCNLGASLLRKNTFRTP